MNPVACITSAHTVHILLCNTLMAVSNLSLFSSGELSLRWLEGAVPNLSEVFNFHSLVKVGLMQDAYS